MPLYRYILGLGLLLAFVAPVRAQSLHPETGEVVVAPETASRSLLRAGAPATPAVSRLGEDLTLLKHLASGETRGIAVVGDVLYRSNGGYFEALDVSDPSAPVVLSRVLAEQSVVQDVQIVGDLAYVVSARSNFPDGAGLRIVNISDPSNLTVVGEALGQTAFGVAVSGDYAYVGASTAGLSVYDISDSTAPTRVTTLGGLGSVLKVALDGTTAYVSGGTSGLRTIDISSPESPSLLGTFTTSGFATNVAYAADVAYVLVNGGGLVAIDVTDLANPSQIGSFAIADGQVRGIQLDGTTAYVTSQSGLVVLDITDPTTITEIGSLAFADANSGSGQSVVLVGDIAYIGNRFDGVRVVDLTDLAMPGEIALIQNGGFSFKIHIDGNYAYIADLIGEYRIIDISDPENAEIVGRADALPNTSDSDVRDGVAYVVDRTGAPGTGLTRFDVSDPTNPVALDTFTTGSQSFGIDLGEEDESVAFIANGFFQFISVDISDPGNFSILDNFNPNSNAFDVQVQDDVAYVANFGGGLVTVDVSDPADMTQLNTNVVGGFLSSVVLDGNRAYLADGQVGLNVADVSDPTMPQSLGTGSIVGIASGVAYSQGFAYIADEGFGLRQYDVTDPANPVETAAVISSDRMTDVDAQGDLIVAVDAGGGIYLFRARDNSPTGIASVDPEELLIEVVPAQTETATLTLSNTGAGPLDYEVSVTATRSEPVTASTATRTAPARFVEGMTRADGSTDARSYTELDHGPRSLYRNGGIQITHSASQTIVDNTGIACSSTGSTAQNSYWRVFDLEDFGLTSGIVTSSVDIGIETANIFAAPPVSTVRLYTLDGAFTTANLTLVAEAEYTINGTDDLTILNVPVTGQFAASDVLVVEWDVPNLQDSGSGVFIGSNTSGQTGPTYVSAEACALTEPTDLASIGFPDVAWVLNVNGEVVIDSAPFVTVDPSSGTVEAGGEQELTVTVDAADAEPGVYEYVLAITTDSPDTPELTVPLSIEVLFTVANEDDAVPTVFTLEAAYPNPFTGSTAIQYALPEAAHVTVEVYDAVGRRVATLVDAEQGVGRYTAEWDARSLASGVYLYRMTAGSFTKTMKVSLVR